MKGFLAWFKSNTKMKRWIFLIAVGVILTCYGISNMIIMKEISILELLKIILSFVLGFSCIVLGVIFIQKRTLEIFIEASDKRMNNKNEINVNSLIFNKKVYSEGPNIVVIGGGSGLNTVLEGLKKYTNNLTAIVTVSDYGKEETKSRKELNILPSDDIKESIIALANDEEKINDLLNSSFSFKKSSELYFSDIFFHGMSEISKDYTEAIENVNKIFNMTGKILPVTLDEMKICAELANGMIIERKDKIPEIVYDKVTKINRVFLNPSNARTTKEVLEAIKKADAIVIGPGSLYTNVIPNLLVNGVSKAIKDSKAIKIYVSNIMTEPGQTDNYSLSEHIEAIFEHAGQGIIDYCIYDSGDIIPEYIKKYNMQGSELVEQDILKVKNKGIQLLRRDLAYIKDDLIRHNPNEVAKAIIEIICDDLKFKDKQSDPQYVMLDAKLRYDKQFSKKPKKQNKKVRKSTKTKGKKKSKFAEKYGDRINSIKNSDIKTDENRRKFEKENNIKKINKEQEELEKMKRILSKFNEKK